MALASKNFADLITFTRTSGGGRFNASGQYEWLAANVPRINYDPITGVCRGILIEEQRTNLLLYSSQFDNTAWKPGSNGTSGVSANAGTSPDGTNTAWLLSDNSGTNVSGLFQQAFITSDMSSYTASVYLKKNTANCISMRVTLSGGTTVVAEVVADPGNGTAMWRSATAGVSFSITPAGNGWYRLACTVSNNGTGNTSIQVEIRPAFASVYGPNIDVTAQGSTYFWGDQLEAGSSPTSYIPTTSAQVTRAADVASVNTLSPWFNAAAGTLVREIVLNNELPTTASASYATALINSGNVNSEIAMRLVSGTPSYADAIARNNGTSVADTANQSLPSPVAGTVIRQAVTWDSQSITTALNGVIGGTNPVTVALPTGLNKLNLLGAGEQVTTGGKSAYIKSIRYYPKRLTDAELKGMTA